MARSPKTLHHFIGQRRLIDLLTRFIDGATTLGRPCPSLLLTAPSGYGKTALAEAIAAEYGSTLYTIFAGEDTRTADLCIALSQLAFGDVLFIDEAHSLVQNAQEVLYAALDKLKAPTLKGSRLDRTQLQSVAAFTLILATNQPGKLRRGLRSRLNNMEFDPYTVRELKAIAERVAWTEGIELTPQAARRLAEIAQGTPRHIYRRLEALQLFWPSVQKFSQEHVDALLNSEGIDVYGLWPQQRHYLHTLVASQNGTCSLERLSVKLGCDPAYIRQDIEPYLIDQGWVEPHSARGRMITATGRTLVADLTAVSLVTNAKEDAA